MMWKLNLNKIHVLFQNQLAGPLGQKTHCCVLVYIWKPRVHMTSISLNIMQCLMYYRA